MPERKTLERAEEDKREGKSPSTQAGEFVREEFEHVRKGKHGARSPKQAIAGVDLPPPKEGTTSEKTRSSAERAYKAGRKGKKKRPSSRRSRAISGVLKRESRSTASKAAIGKQARSAARRRGATARSAAARKAARTKGATARSAAARKAARTRARKRKGARS
jgi:hypothetical protein